MKIVFLVINYMPHQLISIKSVLKTEGVTVHSFCYKEPYSIPENLENFYNYKLKDYPRAQFLKRLVQIEPDMMVVAGWRVKDFFLASKKIRKRFNIPVVSYSDTQWQGSWRQKINCLISPIHLQKAFSHVWVAGIYQYEYARKLGFSNNKIIYNALSCDLGLFKKVSVEQKLNNYPKNFLFIGRLVPDKGIQLLMKAWNLINDKKGWKLTLIGEGVLKQDYIKCDDVVIKDYMPQHLLIKEIEKAGCFILPSIFEPWALVLHEAAAAGLPIIATNICGAAPHFVINDYNGYQIDPSVVYIKRALERIMDKNSKQLYKMSKNSQRLSETITPDLGTAQLLSVIKKI